MQVLAKTKICSVWWIDDLHEAIRLLGFNKNIEYLHDHVSLRSVISALLLVAQSSEKNKAHKHYDENEAGKSESQCGIKCPLLMPTNAFIEESAVVVYSPNACLTFLAVMHGSQHYGFALITEYFSLLLKLCFGDVGGIDHSRVHELSQDKAQVRQYKDRNSGEDHPEQRKVLFCKFVLILVHSNDEEHEDGNGEGVHAAEAGEALFPVAAGHEEGSTIAWVKQGLIVH